MLAEPRNYELDYKYTLANLRYLLECTLASYSSECCKSKPRKGVLDRLESILEKTLVPAAKDLELFVGARSGYSARAEWSTCPRVNEIVAGAKGESEGALGSLRRWFLKERYPAAHGTIPG